MPLTVILKGLAIWLGILVLAMANGVLRETVLRPWLGAPGALILSGVLLSALILAVAYASLPWLQLRQTWQRLAVGLGWLVLTLMFEFLFGLWQGKSWAELLMPYTFKDGNLWPLVLAVTVLAPSIAARLKARQ
ncbi:MAG: hypothetical protein MI794_14460 [Pseudomonadales bacterium]|nr:hypothetical protein [Pseudomonadales bacterium]